MPLDSSFDYRGCEHDRAVPHNEWCRINVTMASVPAIPWEEALARAAEERIPIGVWVTNLIRKAVA